MKSIEELERISMELEKANENMVRNEVLIKQVVILEARLTRQEKHLFNLFKAYEKEQKDVDQLKSLSFKSFYHTLRKDKEAAIEKEEREALEAKVKADRLKYEIESDKSKLELLQSRQVSPDHLENKVKELLEEKYSLMKTYRPDSCEQINGLNSDAYEKQKALKEIDEAIGAGNEVLRSIDAVQGSLRSAENWGTYDMLGGGMMATMIKRDHMKAAMDLTNHLSLTIKRFSDELDDISESFEATLDMDSFLGTADYLFDGLFVDMSVQSRINDAQNQMTALDHRVSRLIQNLDRDKADVQKQMTDIKEQIRKTIIQA